jgi:uncharacterized protein YbjT (DUF2867 family)
VIVTQSTVVVAGATGLVGRECVRQLAAEPSVARTIALVRRPPAPGMFPPSVDVVVLDFALLEQCAAGLGATHVVCALGTTMRQAGSRDAFRLVDHDFVVALARGARAGEGPGAHHFVLVSALGADPDSAFFYNRVKGETEQAVLAVGYRSVTILRPSLLLGARGEFRLGEAIAKRFAWLTPPAYKPVQARDVAAAAVRVIVEDRPGTRIIESRELRRGVHAVA